MGGQRRCHGIKGRGDSTAVGRHLGGRIWGWHPGALSRRGGVGCARCHLRLPSRPPSGAADSTSHSAWEGAEGAEGADVGGPHPTTTAER